jgi:TPR repeat protein
MIGVWFICSAFTVDVPFWTRRKLQKTSQLSFECVPNLVLAILVVMITSYALILVSPDLSATTKRNLLTPVGEPLGSTSSVRQETVAIAELQPSKLYYSPSMGTNGEAAFQIGKAFYDGDPHLVLKQDYERAVTHFKEAAEQGHADAQFYLGVCFAKGRGILPDLSEAVKWYRKAADAGIVEAEFNIAECYYRGRGVSKDMDKAIRYFANAAAHGSADAAYNLGIVYETGEGVTKDYEESAKWFLVAAKAGDVGAQSKLGFLYSVGQGVIKSETEAAIWLRKAAQNGDAAAQTSLAKIYWSGTGVPQDTHESLKWTILAAGQGFPAAVETVRLLKKATSAEAFDEGQRRADEFVRHFQKPSNLR